jgi:uncharacterized protein DUF1161
MRNSLVVVVAWSLFSMSSFAQQKPCEELKAEVAAKLDAKGVKDYTLKIVTPEEVKSEKVVGSCEGGKKRLIYERK